MTTLCKPRGPHTVSDLAAVQGWHWSLSHLGKVSVFSVLSKRCRTVPARALGSTGKDHKASHPWAAGPLSPADL